MTSQEPDRNDEQEEQEPGFWAIVKSTLAAALGVQSDKNRERDFKHGNIKTFAVAGLIFTVAFIATIVLVVKVVLSSAGM